MNRRSAFFRLRLFSWTFCTSALIVLGVMTALRQGLTLPLGMLTSVACILAGLLAFRWCAHLIDAWFKEEQEASFGPVIEKLESLDEFPHDKTPGACNVGAKERLENAVCSITTQLADVKRQRDVFDAHSKSALHLQGRFLRTVSEDIRAPLLKIVYGLRALGQATTNRAQGVMLQSLYASSFRVLGSINDALELGRPEMPEANELRAVSFNQIAQDLAELYAETVNKQGNVVLCFFVDHKLPDAVTAEPRRLMHLVGNLIENALRFSKTGLISVTIETSSSDVPAEQVCPVVISCSDSGIGIDPSRLERMKLEISGRLPEDHVSELGLGLQAVVSIVKQNDGKLEIKSKQGIGTKITAELKFPVAVAARDFSEMPHFFCYHTRSKRAELSLLAAAQFHGVRAVGTDDPAVEKRSEVIFIDAALLFEDKGGNAVAFKARERYVVLLKFTDLHRREELRQLGFRRFVMLPLTSTAIILALLGEDTQLPAVTASGGPGAPQGSLKVLIVDDVRTTRLRVSEYLKEQGHTVTEASDGLELVELLTGGIEFDLVLCDLTMNHLDGVDATKQVRAYEANGNRRTPIYAMTAYSFIHGQRFISEIGFDGILKKPVYPHELDFITRKVIATKVVEEKPMTKVIDLDDLRERTGGKARIMIQVLDSFIETARLKVSELKSTDKEGVLILPQKVLHALKGLLLEVGACDNAAKVAAYEKLAASEEGLSQEQLLIIQGLVDQTCVEASGIRRELSAQAE